MSVIRDKERPLIKQFFSSQPIFKKNELVWGHELIARDNFASQAIPRGAKNGETLPTILANSLRNKRAKEKVVLRYSPEALLGRLPQTPSPENTVVEVPESAEITPVFITTLDQLKQDGYLIGVDDFEGTRGKEALAERADIVKINILGKRPQHVIDLMGLVPNMDTQIVAKGVVRKELLFLAQALGFNLFQGSFFKKPEIVTGRTLNSTEAARLELFNIIEENNTDFKRLSEAISRDASISYRLLVFLNSAAFSFPSEITSINHAVVILGWEQIKTWLRIAILNDLAPDKKKRELTQLASQRSNFFKLTAERSNYKAISPDKLFLLGLFSLLEPLMGMPMQDVVENLPIDETLKRGLCREKNLYSVWIELANRTEMADWAFVDRVIKFLKLDPKIVTASYYDSHVLTNSFYESS